MNGQDRPAADSIETTLLDEANAVRLRGAEAAVPVEWRQGDVILDLYEIRGRLGEGGMGVVHRVHHRTWGVDLAVKSPRPEAFVTAGAREGFIREAETWVGLGLHPHVVACHYVRTLGGIPRVFAQLIEGGSLSDSIRKRTLYEGGRDQALARVLDVAIQFAWGLEHAHASGLVHQDVKPGNVMLTSDGQVLVTDFGLSRARSMVRQATDGEASHSGLVTVVGMTPQYCSPEQAIGQRLSRRTDVWSWAVSVLHMLIGRMVWKDGREAPSVLEQYLAGGRQTAVPHVPAAVADLLRACLAEDPRQRPRSMSDIGASLQDAHERLTGTTYGRPWPEAVAFRADELNNRALSYLDLGKLDDARAEFRKALDLDPFHPQAIYNLGLVQWRTGRLHPRELERQLENCRAGRRKGVSSLLAKVYLEQLDLGRARDVLKDDSAGLQAVLAGQQPAAIGSQTLHVCGLPQAISPDGLRALEFNESNPDIRLMLLDVKEQRRKEIDRYLAFHPEPQLIHVGDLRDFPEGERTLQGHLRGVRCGCFSPDGTLAISAGSWDDTVRVWDTQQARCLAVLNHATDVLSVCFAPGTASVVTGDSDGDIRLWSIRQLPESSLVSTLSGVGMAAVTAVGVSRDGRTVISGDRHGMVRLWDVESERVVSTLAGHTDDVTCVCLSRDGRLALSGSDDRTVRLWDTERQEPVGVLAGHTQPVRWLCISRDQRLALSAGRYPEDRIHIWDLGARRCLATLEGYGPVLFMRDGHSALARTGDRLCRWDLSHVAHRSNRAKRAEFELCRPVRHAELKHEESILLAVCRDIDHLVANSRNDSAYAALTQHWKQGGFAPNDHLDMRHRILARRAAPGGCLTAGELERLDHIDQRESPSSPGVNVVSISPDGRRALSSGGCDPWIRLWDLEASRCTAAFGTSKLRPGHEWPVECCAVSADWRLALSLTADQLDLWDLEKAQRVATVEHNPLVACVALSPDGRSAILGGENLVHFWDLEERRLVGSALANPESRTRAVCVGPDGRTALSASAQGAMRVWDMETRQCLGTLDDRSANSQYSHPCKCVAVSPDGRLAVSGAHGLWLWDLNRRECLGTFWQTGTKVATVTSVALTPDGRVVLSGGEDGSLQMWHLETRQLLFTLIGHSSAIRSIAVSRDGRLALSGSDDGTVRVWRILRELSFPDGCDWDEAVRPYLRIFLTLRNGEWNDRDFKTLIHELAEQRGLGWIRPQGIRTELEKMTDAWVEGKAPPPGRRASTPVRAQPAGSTVGPGGKIPGLPYTIVGDLSGGLYADVYAAVGSSGPVVIKLARVEPRPMDDHRFQAQGVLYLTGDTLAANPHPNEVLVAEARTLARIRHRGFVRLLDQAELEIDGSSRVYLLLEHIGGFPLRHLVEARERSTLRCFAAAVEALAKAHATGELPFHGDVKPDNILVTAEGPRIIDPSSGFAGARLHTRAYCAADLATDCPAIGMTLLELLLGEHPLRAARDPKRPRREIRFLTLRGDEFDYLPSMPLPHERWPDASREVEQLALHAMGLEAIGSTFHLREPLSDIVQLSEALNRAVGR